MKKSMNPFKKINVFSSLMVILTFAVVLRLFDISSFSARHSAAESTPAAQKFTPVNAPPPAAAAAAPAAAATVPPPSADLTQPPVASPYGEHAYSAAEVGVLESLAKRRDELDRREQQMGKHEALLKAAEEEVDRKIAELNKIKGELEALLNKQQTVQEERLNSLVKIYEGMKPKEAARIFDTLEMDVLLDVIAKMSERKSSPILANMNPEKARALTIKLSEEHKLPTLPDNVKKNKPATPIAAPANAPATP